SGEIQNPFTTGLLLGIGETPEDWRETLGAIATLHLTHGHIQEVILQPHSPGTSQAKTEKPFPPAQLIEVVQVSRELLPANITLQIPPNLVDDDCLLACLEQGARDLGGIGPTDEVNPDYPHPTAARLAARLQPGDWHLQPRLPVYPQHDAWLPSLLRQSVQQWRTRLGQSPANWTKAPAIAAQKQLS
ncbi:MAG: 7,8-didemethyl-8-hydroxy-5-deazariboflavin synthase subunit CofG, partial [Cyanobacteria bacterium Co-bin8]|nr:7,8-didemethyl-8-hydroxy-5-deazariboflavin synthase subunit CofG [Cyanobacteria bacterium Co-bin8]